jgi:hypothetical protein
MNKLLRRCVSLLLYLTFFTGTLFQLETSYARAELTPPSPEQTEDMQMGALMGVSAAKPGIIMEELNKTFLSELMKSWKLTVSGWTDGSFTGSSASQTNLPLKFNYQANTFLLQQNWLRIDRPVRLTSKMKLPVLGCGQTGFYRALTISSLFHVASSTVS